MNTNLSSPQLKFQNFCQKASFFCVISFMVFTPVSTALMNIFIFLTLIFVLLSGNLKKTVLLAWENPVSRSSLFLFLLLIVSLSWTINLNDAFDILKKYNELWYFALLIPIFNSNYRRNFGINAFLISMSIVLFGIYLMYFEIILPIHWTLKGTSGHFTIDGGFASHILTNILMAFAMFVSAQMLVASKFILKIPYLVFVCFSFYYVLFISSGTSGQILAICLILLFIIQHGGIRSVLLIPGVILLIAITAISNKSFYENTISAAVEANSLQRVIVKMQKQYHHATTNDTAGNNTRPRIYFNALKLIRQEPWIGSGVGSFEEALKKYQPKFHTATTVAKKNPHNEYLMISVQLGAAGLLLLLNLFYKQAAFSEKISRQEYKNIAQGLVILIIIGCMGNSMLLDSREGHFWAFFSALLFSNILDKEN